MNESKPEERKIENLPPSKKEATSVSREQILHKTPPPVKHAAPEAGKTTPKPTEKALPQWMRAGWDTWMLRGLCLAIAITGTVLLHDSVETLTFGLCLFGCVVGYFFGTAQLASGMIVLCNLAFCRHIGNPLGTVFLVVAFMGMVLFRAFRSKCEGCRRLSSANILHQTEQPESSDILNWLRTHAFEGVLAGWGIVFCLVDWHGNLPGITFPVITFSAMVLLFGIRAERQLWWRIVLRQLDAGWKKQKKTKQNVGVPDGWAGMDARFLRFFSGFCRILLVAILAMALLVFYIKVPWHWVNDGLRSWSEPEYVRLFGVFEFFDTLFGEGHLALRYWIAVLVSCAWVLAEALYARSVAETVKKHASILKSLNDKVSLFEDLRDSGVFDFGGLWKVLAGLLGVATLVRIIYGFGTFGMGMGLLLALILLVAGGGLAVGAWGWGSLFCLQAWNAAAATLILHDLTSRNPGKTVLTEEEHRIQGEEDAEQRKRQSECWLVIVEKYRELAVATGG